MKMRIEEPRVMKELHAIRAKHYEETKHMTRAEYVESIREEAQKIIKKYNLKFEYIEKH